MTDPKSLREKLDAMVAEKRNTDSVYVLQDVALDLLARLDAAEAPGTADALKRCVWMPTAGGKWSPGCSPEAWDLDTKAKVCPGCGHPVQVKQKEDAAEEE